MKGQSRHVRFLDPISGFFSRVSRSVPFSKKKDPRRGGGPKKGVGSWICLDMMGLGCGKQVLGVRAAKTTTERVREFGVLIFLFDFTY